MQINGLIHEISPFKGNKTIINNDIFLRCTSVYFFCSLLIFLAIIILNVNLWIKVMLFHNRQSIKNFEPKGMVQCNLIKKCFEEVRNFWFMYRPFSKYRPEAHQVFMIQVALFELMLHQLLAATFFYFSKISMDTSRVNLKKCCPHYSSHLLMSAKGENHCLIRRQKVYNSRCTYGWIY